MHTPAPPPSLQVIAVQAPLNGDFDDIVTKPCARVLEQLRGLLQDNSTPTETVALLLTTPPRTSNSATHALHEALFEALRGIVGSLTLEYRRQLRINLIRTSETDAAEDTLQLLDDGLGAFAAGATLDLTGVFE